MNRKELMERVNKREIDKRNEVIWLWFIYVAIPTVVILTLYIAARAV